MCSPFNLLSIKKRKKYIKKIFIKMEDEKIYEYINDAIEKKEVKLLSSALINFNFDKIDNYLLSNDIFNAIQSCFSYWEHKWDNKYKDTEWYEDELNLLISAALFTCLFSDKQRIKMLKMREQMFLENKKNKINNYIISKSKWDEIEMERKLLETENQRLKEKIEKIQQNVIFAINNCFK